MRVAIAGAGIGGLAAALSLHATGIDVEVFESSREIRPLGVGINLLPQAVRELTELGLADELAAAGVATAELAYHDRFGNRIWTEPRGCEAGYRWPQYSIHRGRLQMLLLGAVLGRMGSDAVRTGFALERFEQTRGGVRLWLRDRRNCRQVTSSADALVGADGIHSATRALLHPDEGRPIWNGIRMWRGVSEAQPFLSGRTMIMAGSNRHAKFVAYPISAPWAGCGRAEINWVGEVRLGQKAAMEPGGWNRKGQLADVLRHFGDWHFPWLDIPALIRAATVIYEYPMVDRDPLDWWGRGRVTLLGDAAHPMYPIGSNGASQAILDARLLAFELSRTAGVASALEAYEQRRRPPTTALVIANRQMGPEQAMVVVEERAPNGFVNIEDVMSRAELEEITSRYRAIAGFEVASLNARPSWTPAQCHLTRPLREAPPPTIG
jgi:2-polyprenyl-6-methoxyphenol hydroxylase-like FAD-dependent oxidoreductase